MTAEVFLQKIKASAELVDELKAVKDGEALAAFLKKHDCAATAEEFQAALKRELSDDALEGVAGGGLLESLPWDHLAHEPVKDLPLPLF